MNHRELGSLLKQTYSAWSGHNASRLGAALAFYSLLSLAPLLVVVMALAGIFFDHVNAQDQITNQVEQMIGNEGGNAIRTMIEHAGRKPSSGLVASAIGMVTLLFGASSVFGELQSALNTMWDIEPSATTGIWSTIRQRIFAFGMVLAVGFLLLVSLVISAALAAIGKYFGGLLPVPETILSAINFIVSLLGVAFLFGLIFRYVPDTRTSWRHIGVGAVMTALLFTVGKYLIGIYLGKAAVGSAYGAAGSLVVLVIWVYYSALIFLFGAELTRVIAMRDRPTRQN